MLECGDADFFASLRIAPQHNFAFLQNTWEHSMESDRVKWNRRFESEESYLGLRPSPLLQREIERIRQLTPGNRALDIACGEGRNSIFLAQQGYRVTGIDISDTGLDKARKRAKEAGVDIDFQQVDLDGHLLTKTYDLIINFNFLLRDLIVEEFQALSPGGVLVFDTIMESDELLASHNPLYLLRQGELQRIFERLDGEILVSEELCSGEMPTARILVQKST
jgi:2-polyprenyl-3-methyl-5-hydroxy-6-metoxy-1,4-benzoquinol methylase